MTAIGVLLGQGLIRRDSNGVYWRVSEGCDYPGNYCDGSHIQAHETPLGREWNDDTEARYRALLTQEYDQAHRAGCMACAIPPAELDVVVASVDARQDMPARQAQSTQRDRALEFMREDGPFVYFIAPEDRPVVKIGKANNIKSRIRELQTGSADRLRLLAAIQGDERQEQQLHRRFAGLRLQGEWFRLEGALAEYVDQLSGAA